MLKKALFILLVTCRLFSMEMGNECSVEVSMGDSEVDEISLVKKNLPAILGESDDATKSIIEYLLTQDSGKKSSAEQKRHKSELLRKMSELGKK